MRGSRRTRTISGSRCSERRTSTAAWPGSRTRKRVRVLLQVCASTSLTSLRSSARSRRRRLTGPRPGPAPLADLSHRRRKILEASFPGVHLLPSCESRRLAWATDDLRLPSHFRLGVPGSKYQHLVRARHIADRHRRWQLFILEWRQPRAVQERVADSTKFADAFPYELVVGVLACLVEHDPRGGDLSIRCLSEQHGRPVVVRAGESAPDAANHPLNGSGKALQRLGHG